MKKNSWPSLKKEITKLKPIIIMQKRWPSLACASLLAMSPILFTENKSNENERGLIINLSQQGWQKFEYKNSPFLNLHSPGLFYECHSEEKNYEIFFDTEKQIYIHEKQALEIQELVIAKLQCEKEMAPSFIQEI